MNILDFIIVVGSVQGIITGLLISFLKANIVSNRILAALLFLTAIAGINLYLDQKGWYYINTFTAILHALIPMVIIMPVGPLIFFYIRSSLDSGFTFKKKDTSHFLPVIIDLVPQLTAILFFACSFAGLSIISTRSLGRFIDQYNVYSDIPRWFSITIYLWLSARHLRSAENKLTGNLSAKWQKLHWLKRFVRYFFLFQAIWLPYLVIYIIPSYTNKLLDQMGWYPVYLPLAILIYYVGLKGYAISFGHTMNEKKMKDGGAPEFTDSVVQTIIRSMEEDKCYLNPLLDLATLSRHTGISAKTISATLNQHLKKNFNDFVNSYRVVECQSKMQNDDFSHLTIVGIASECGFNSPSTFQRVFKQMTGLSPSDFRKSVKVNP